MTLTSRYLLGIDLGSSSIKVSILVAESGTVIASATSPTTEMEITSVKPGWAEQDPEIWWENLKTALTQLWTQAPSAKNDISAIGIAYQMHGLVLVDKDQKIVRPSIIWCDSRAVELGEDAAQKIGYERCLTDFLNFPGNFTAAKLRWVMLNEPANYARTHKFMLPGDFIAMKLSGEIATTVSGLSEGILWNFAKDEIATEVLNIFEIDPAKVATTVDTFSEQSRVSKSAAAELGIPEGVPISYRAGDQPNNAFSLKVLEPGDVATTAGTSGVVYGIADSKTFDPQARVNLFAHVNHQAHDPRLGVLLCLNGAAILYRWLRSNLFTDLSYAQMDELAAQSPVGANGLKIYPFGNGAERTLGNREIGAAILRIDFNRHTRADILRASLEGIAFALRYGLNIMRSMGVESTTVRAGRANLFLSPVFRQAFCSANNVSLELFNTDGSQGAARAAGVGAGIFNLNSAFIGLKQIDSIDPDLGVALQYESAYQDWLVNLENKIGERHD